MSEQRTSEPITAVHVQLEDDFSYVCQWRDEAGGYTCGRCGQGALGPFPKHGDACTECKATVNFVRRGPPPPSHWPENFL